MSVKFATKLDFNQKNLRASIAQEFLSEISDDFDLQERVVIVDLVLLLPKLKRQMKGREFTTVEEIKTATSEILNAIPISVSIIEKSVDTSMLFPRGHAIKN